MPRAGSRTGGYIWIVAIVVGLLLAAMVVVGILIAPLLLPAVRAAREAARTAQSMSNMKQIALAMTLFETKEHSLPARAIFDKKGKALLSWRVQLLPYVEQMPLYRQFHLDEPWDSPHNLALAARIPPVYSNPNRPEDGKTNYLVPVGVGTVFDGDKQIRLKDVADSGATTIILVEADEDRAVPWTKPDDLDVNFDQPMDGLGHFRARIFLAAFCDGSVHKLSATIDPAAMTAFFARAGDNKVPPGIGD